MVVYILDMHSHILPCVDDGSTSLEMSISMLEESYNQGVNTIVATPHYYISRHSDMDRYLDKRGNAFSQLQSSVKDRTDVPDIYLGAEVRYFNNLANFEELDKLTINNGEYFLLEMPFAQWNDRIILDVENIIYKRKLKPVIAHIERYIGFQKGTDSINELLALDVIVQSNAAFVNSIFSRSKALKWIDSEIIQILGSDCHNMGNRKPDLGKAYNIVSKKLGEDKVNSMNNLAKTVLGI